MDSERDIRWVRRKCWSIWSFSLQLGLSWCWRSEFNVGSTLTTSEMAELKLRTMSLLFVDSAASCESSDRFPVERAGLFSAWLRNGFASLLDSLITLVPWFSNIRMRWDSNGLTRVVLLALLASVLLEIMLCWEDNFSTGRPDDGRLGFLFGEAFSFSGDFTVEDTTLSCSRFSLSRLEPGAALELERPLFFGRLFRFSDDWDWRLDDGVDS